MPSNKDNCPHCGVTLIGDPIPEDMRQHYSRPYFWRREIGIEYDKDRVEEWKCPDCGGVWKA